MNLRIIRIGSTDLLSNILLYRKEEKIGNHSNDDDESTLYLIDRIDRHAGLRRCRRSNYLILIIQINNNDERRIVITRRNNDTRR